MATYNVTLGNSSTPESGDQNDDWIRFVCDSFTPEFLNNNEIENLQSHEMFEIKLGEMKFAVTLNNVIIRRVETSAVGSVAWNDFVKFVGAHAMSDGDDLYLHIQMPMDDVQDWVQFFDDEGDMQDYMKCRIKQFRFTIEAKKQYGKGQIKLEELWD